VTAEPNLSTLIVPEGWTLETMARQPDHVLLSTPAPFCYSVTIDFKLRGFRTGYSSIGRLVGEAWDRKRKKYGGRGWKQEIVNDAVKYLKELL
jgi:hypothetical protein